MFASRRPAGRFSLLLLDENEFYVRDFVATCNWPTDVVGNWHGTISLSGQLRLCTKSLFFEPDDVRVPIVRLPFQYLEQLEGVGKQEVGAVAERWYKMKANAADEPYVFEKNRTSTWKFKLTYAALADFMPLAQRILLASRLPSTDQESFLDEILTEVESTLRFDPGHLRNPSIEMIKLEVPAMRLAPLIKEPCRLAVTTTRLYMQPLHNITGDTAVRSHPLAAIAAVARRRSALKDVGLEVFFVDPPVEAAVQGPLWGAASVFFTFKSREEREQAVHTITSQPCLGQALPGGQSVAAACGSLLEVGGGGWLPRVTAAWQHGRLSNFDYLLYCNLAAGRSFNDLTQYPVFPWVLQDYSSSTLDLLDPGVFRDLSKPIGAINPARLAKFRERYADMADFYHCEGGDPPFLYGTHYSCPGYTLFWLVRAVPDHMLRLQNGRFDAADRAFCSISDAWDSVLTNPADVKELIPEFYMPERPEFLLNMRRLALGVMQDGRHVGDVELPGWAEGSAERFLAMNRAALESPFVSANLHYWLDLIFGVKQRGHAAVDADNVFRHLTYEGAIDPETISDRVQRAAAEVAINEFGQCPRQIFSNPHPSRLVCPPPPPSPPSSLEKSFSATSSTHLSPRSPTSATAPQSTSAGQTLSLGLVSAIVATLDEEEHPGSILEIPALLRELDVVAARRRKSSSSGSNAEGARRSGDSRDNRKTSMNQHRVVGGVQEENSGDALSDVPSPFASTRVAAAGLMGRWSALRGAIGERLRKEDSNGGDGAAEYTTDDGGSSSSVASIHSSITGSSSGGGGGVLPTASGRLSGFAGSISSRWASATSQIGGGIGGGVTRGSLDRGVSEKSASPPEAVPPAVEKVETIEKDDADAVEETEAKQGASPLVLHWKTASSPLKPHLQQKKLNSIDGEEEEEEQPSPSPSATEKETLTKTVSWGAGLRDRLRLGRSFIAGSEGVHAAEAFFAEGSPCIATAGHDGTLRIFNAATGVQLRSSHLGAGQPLTSLALLSPFSSSSSHTTGAPLGGGSRSRHPTILCGSYDGNVYVYNTTTGQVEGTFTPHTDAVSCIALSSPSIMDRTAPSNAASSSVPLPPPRYLATTSWDCSLKLWRIVDGKEKGCCQHQPWDSTLPQPVAAIDDLPGGVWALDLTSDGRTALVGTEEGHAVLIDFELHQSPPTTTTTESSSSSTRSTSIGKIRWQAEVSQDYIGGVKLLPGGHHALVACADGTLALLDCLHAGEVLSSVVCGTPLRCCTSDGSLGVAGGENGAVLFWDISQQLNERSGGGGLFAGVDGLFAPLIEVPQSSVNALVVKKMAGGPRGETLCVVTGHDGGLVRVHWAK